MCLPPNRRLRLPITFPSRTWYHSVGGLCALPFVLKTKVLLLVHQPGGVRERALALFAGKAQRAVGLGGQVVIVITTSAELRDLNRKYRHKDEPTDVLSFESHSGQGKITGDIAISAEIAAANAAELGHSTETEIKILILHGLLHLAGYDHEIDGGKMQGRETALRQQLKLPAGLIERAHANATPAGKEIRPAGSTRGTRR
jgi:probable rRNA maturation factor